MRTDSPILFESMYVNARASWKGSSRFTMLFRGKCVSLCEVVYLSVRRWMTSCRGPIGSESTLTISDSTATRIAASMWKITKAVVSPKVVAKTWGSVLNLIVHGSPDVRARQLHRSPHDPLDVITEAVVCLVLPVVLAHHRHLTVGSKLVTAKPLTSNRVQITS